MSQRVTIELRFGAVLLAALQAVSILATDARAEQATVYWDKPQRSDESVIFSQRVQAITGEVQEFSGKRIVVQQVGRTEPTVIAVDQLTGVRVIWESEPAVRAHEHFRIGNWRDCILATKEANDLPDVPDWQRKMLSLQVVSAATHFEKLETATLVFKALRQREMPNFGYAYLPVAWSTVAPNSAVVQAAEKFASDTDAAAKLVAATWLLHGPQRQASVKALESIAQGNEPVLSQIAKTQLWRTIAPQEFVTSHLSKAINFRDSMPLYLQAGPTAVIADRVERSGDWAGAWNYWLEVAMTSRNSQLPVFNTAIDHLTDLAQRTGREADWLAIREALEVTE